MAKTNDLESHPVGLADKINKVYQDEEDITYYRQDLAKPFKAINLDIKSEENSLISNESYMEEASREFRI